MSCVEFTRWMAFFEMEGDTTWQDEEDRAATEAANAAAMRAAFAQLKKDLPHE